MQSFYQKKIQTRFNTFNMANTKELSVEDKLKAIYALQLIDSKIDEIRNVRGELPLEVEDLQDEIEGLDTRMNNLQTELEAAENRVSERKNSIVDSKELIKKIAVGRMYLDTIKSSFKGSFCRFSILFNKCV